VFGRVRLQFWVCGVFEVEDGRITHTEERRPSAITA
jgi:limonene-1,2-epoxide hydrolase